MPQVKVEVEAHDLDDTRGLALAGSLSHALFRAAEADRTELSLVRVRIITTQDSIEYDVDVEGDALPETLRALVARAHEDGRSDGDVALELPLRLGAVNATSVFPVRTLDEALAVCRFMEGWPGPWWVGGGWAIDMWIGAASREHEDVEICVPREDQATLREFVPDWQSLAPKAGRWVPLEPGELLEPPAHMWQLRRTNETEATVEGMPPRWELLLTEIEDGRWTFPFDPSIQLSLNQLVVPSPLGPPVMAPEVVLLHKAYQRPRPKDDHDFKRAREQMNAAQRAWLHEHLSRLLPDHRWLGQLSE